MDGASNRECGVDRERQLHQALCVSSSSSSSVTTIFFSPRHKVYGLFLLHLYPSPTLLLLFSIALISVAKGDHSDSRLIIPDDEMLRVCGDLLRAGGTTFTGPMELHARFKVLLHSSQNRGAEERAAEAQQKARKKYGKNFSR